MSEANRNPGAPDLDVGQASALARGPASAPAGGHDEPAPRSRAATYAAVLALEALVIAALWLFSLHFSA